MSRRSARRLAPDVFYRAVVETIRAVEGDERTFEFVVATEAPVHVGYGVPEVLRMSGCKLRRFRKNPVVIDSHGDGINAILGTAEWRIEGKRSIAKVTLDETPEGEAARARIQSGSLRTASIGYRPNWRKAVELREGQKDGDVEGPAIVQREWEPYEITLCPVPADEDAVRRRSFETNRTGRSRKDQTVKYSDLPGQQPPDELDVDSLDVEQDLDGEPEQRSAPPAKKPAPAAKPRVLPPITEELEQRREAARAQSIRSIAPKGLESVADDCVLEGLSLDAARERLKAARAQARKPNGTPEPTETPAPKAEDKKADEAFTPEAVERALKARS